MCNMSSKIMMGTLGDINIILCYKYCVKIIQNHDYSLILFVLILITVADHLN